MTIKGVLWRFLALYAVLLVVAGFALNYLGIKSNSGVNMGILVASVMSVCVAFARKNARYFSAKEKTAVVLGLSGINILLQLLFSAAALSQLPGGLNSGALIFGVVFVGVLHTIAIYFFVGLAKRPLVKQGIIAG